MSTTCCKAGPPVKMDNEDECAPVDLSARFKSVAVQTDVGLCPSQLRNLGLDVGAGPDILAQHLLKLITLSLLKKLQV